MGIFDKLRRSQSSADSRSKRLEKDVDRLLEEYRRKISAAYADAERVIKRQPKLSDRDAMLLEAASIGLMPVPVHLAPVLEGYNKTVAEAQRLGREMYAEHGVVFDDHFSAYSHLRQQTWWPEFIDFVRQELNISDADSIGRWQPLFKKVAPYVYDIVLVYQSRQEYGDDAPVASWTWRVNLLDGSVEAI